MTRIGQAVLYEGWDHTNSKISEVKGVIFHVKRGPGELRDIWVFGEGKISVHRLGRPEYPGGDHEVKFTERTIEEIEVEIEAIRTLSAERVGGVWTGRAGVRFKEEIKKALEAEYINRSPKTG